MSTEKQFIVIAGAGDSHWFKQGEIITLIREDNGIGVYQDATGKQQYLYNDEVKAVSVTEIKAPKAKTVKKAVAVKAPKLHAVRDTKDGLFIDVFATRKEARACKASYGGLKSGIEIIQYTPAAKIR